MFVFVVDGYVYKLVEWYDRLGEEHSNLVDVFEATVPDAVRAIEISSKVLSLCIISSVVCTVLKSTYFW